MSKETVEEIEHIEADARLRTLRIQYPVRIEVFLVCPLTLFQFNNIARRLTIIIQGMMLVADSGIAVGGSPTCTIQFAVGSGSIDVIAISSFLGNIERYLAGSIGLLALSVGITYTMGSIGRGIFLAGSRIGETECLGFQHLTCPKRVGRDGGCGILSTFLSVRM